MTIKYIYLLCYILSINFTNGKIHQFEIIGDSRGYFPISTFGFYRNGLLNVNVTNFKFDQQNIAPNPINDDIAGCTKTGCNIGFVLEKSINSFQEPVFHECKLNNKSLSSNDNKDQQQVFFIFRLNEAKIDLYCGTNMTNLIILNGTFQEKMEDISSGSSMTDTNLFNGRLHKKEGVNKNSQTLSEKRNFQCKKSEEIIINKDKDDSYNFSFTVIVSNEAEEGQYKLSFSNCYNYLPDVVHKVDIALKVEEINPDSNYLSAGEIPLPALYFMMSMLFFLSASFWFFLLKKSKYPVFKIHYLMGFLVVIKALSLMLHGINYHFIQVYGRQIKTWAVMYYIMHLLKGALLFIVLALIGSGWAFIKHVLSSKEKKIFMIVIPLQIIANVATIIIDETEESNSDRDVWMQVLYLIDFLCCGAILLPVVWSIRHLQEASQTDGKAAINLRKLKLFRHFYIMIICYIYFTRIIVYLLRITVPFQYKWLDDMCHEMATYAFFVLVGYKFRPETNNPYFRVELEEDTVLTTTGLTENLTKVNQKLLVDSDESEEEELNLVVSHHKESSHEFD